MSPTPTTWRDIEKTSDMRRGERLCPCGRHALADAHKLKHANKACQMRDYRVKRAADAAKGLRKSEAEGRTRTPKTTRKPAAKAAPKAAAKASSPARTAKAPAKAPAKALPARPAVDRGAPPKAAPAAPPKAPDAGGRDALLAAARAVDAPPKAPSAPATQLDKTAPTPSLTPEGKPLAGKISDAIRACLGLPASTLLFYVKPGVIPTWCRRRRWRGGWRLSQDRRCFLGRNLPTIRAAAEGFELDAPTGRLTLRDGTPLPGVDLAHVSACRSALYSARFTLRLPPQVVAVLGQAVPTRYAPPARSGLYN